MNLLKRVFAVMLTLVMMFGLFPTEFATSAYAEVHTEANGIGFGGNNARLTNKYTGVTGTAYGLNNHILSLHRDRRVILQFLLEQYQC